MRDGCRDFRSGEPIEALTFFDDKIDIHHIFPEKWCKDEKHPIEPHIYNSIINKTAISARTNRMIGGRDPSHYLRTLEKDSDIDPGRMDELLKSHCIAPKTLRSDNFHAFHTARAESLLERIEKAMEKKITRDLGLFAPGQPTDDYDDGPREWDEEESLEEAVA